MRQLRNVGPPDGRVYGELTRFGALLRAIRLGSAPPMSLRDAAEVWDVKKDVLSRSERGQIPIADTFLQICAAAGITPHLDLFQPPIHGELLDRFLDIDKEREKEIQAALEQIIASDFTPEYGPGEPNALGDAPSDGAAWLTPLQIASDILSAVEE